MIRFHKTWLLFLTCLCSFVLISCNEPNKRLGDSLSSSNDKVIYDLRDSSKRQKSSVENVETSTKNIEENVNESVQLLDKNLEGSTEEVKRSYQPIYSNLSNIVLEVGKIRSAVEVLFETINQNLKTAKNIRSLENKIRELEQAKVELENNAIKKLYSNINFIFGFGAIAVLTGCIVWAFGDKKIGFMILCIGLLSTAFAAGAIYYLKAVATIGIIILLVGCVGAVILTGYSFAKSKKDAKIKEQAIRENVELINQLKEVLTPEEFDRFFGNHDTAIARTIQSKTTQEKVNQIRKTIPKSEKHVDKETGLQIDPKG